MKPKINQQIKVDKSQHPTVNLTECKTIYPFFHPKTIQLDSITHKTYKPKHKTDKPKSLPLVFVVAFLCSYKPKCIIQITKMDIDERGVIEANTRPSPLAKDKFRTTYKPIIDTNN